MKGLLRTIPFLVIGVLLVVFATCGGDDGGDDNSGPTTKSGESCETESTTVCGKSTTGTEAVLMCIATGNGTIWSESEVCTKAQNCVNEEKCEINCDSAWLCDGKECGDDGCSGSCGGCPVGTNCVGGICMEYVCEPSCAGLECGPDGCGGECGECLGTNVCIVPDYTCGPKPAGCIPDCADKQCGPNGCGGSCGICSDGTFCAPGTQTCDQPCMPSCEGKVCGDDGCGGSCGICPGENEFCINNQCGPCDPVGNAGCPEDSYCTYVNNKGPQCDVAGTQMYGEPCGGTDSCAEGVCIELSATETGALCYQFCNTHSDCGEGNQCMDLQSSLYKVCGAGAGQLDTCNLLTQDCELDTDGCYYDSGAGEPVCLTAGEGLEGDGCSGQPNECTEGFTCVSASGSGWLCRKFCNTKKGEEPACTTDGTYPKCTNYYAAQKAGYCKED